MESVVAFDCIGAFCVCVCACACGSWCEVEVEVILRVCA